MPVTVSVSLVGVADPQQVQIEVDGLTVSDIVTIQGVLGVHTWTVRGADGISAPSTQVIRRDNLAPVNAAFTYTVTVNGTQYVSDAITVPYSADYVLTTLDGYTVATMTWVDNSDPIAMSFHQHLTPVPGRRTPVIRYADGGGESGSWTLFCEGAANIAALKAMLRPGAPLIMRTNGSLLDFPPARIVAVVSASLPLVGEGTSRMFDTGWVEVADPLGTIPVTGWTFADMNTVVTALGGTFADLNAFIVTLGGTFADVNRFDWESEAAS